MKFSGLLWWFGAFVFALLAGILTFGMLSNTSSVVATQSEGGPTRPVVVASNNIPFRRSISETELVIRELPVDSIPDGAATTLDQVVGKMSTVDVFASEPILVQQLVTPDIVTQQVALSVPDGKIVMAVPTESKLINNRLIRPGDSIDLLATFKLEVVRKQASGPMSESISLLQSLEVHAIILPVATIDDGPTEGGVFRTVDEDAQSVLLAVDPQDALIIRHILDVGGSLDLALRAPGDGSAIDTVAVDQFYLAERYQIDLVRDLDLNPLVR